MLQRKTKAMAGEHPEAHLHTRLVRTLPNALRRPEGRRPNLRAFPLHITLASLTNLFVIGKSCLHLVLASIPHFFIRFVYFFFPMRPQRLRCGGKGYPRCLRQDRSSDLCSNVFFFTPV